VRAVWRELCTMLALMPRAMTTLAIEAPDALHSFTTCALSSVLYLCRIKFLSAAIVSTWL
jgi:hypothetical protein